jgi:hypothetical protein
LEKEEHQEDVDSDCVHEEQKGACLRVQGPNHSLREAKLTTLTGTRPERAPAQNVVDEVLTGSAAEPEPAAGQ